MSDSSGEYSLPVPVIGHWAMSDNALLLFASMFRGWATRDECPFYRAVAILLENELALRRAGCEMERTAESAVFAFDAAGLTAERLAKIKLALELMDAGPAAELFNDLVAWLDAVLWCRSQAEQELELMLL